MDVQEFLGNHQARVDEKYRLKLPADFKRVVDEVYGPRFFITSENGKRAKIYPMKVWQANMAEVAKLPTMDPDRADYMDVTTYYGQVVEMDSAGRLLMPPVIRQSAKLMGEVNVFGKTETLEVVNLEMFLAERMGPGGFVEVSRAGLTAMSEKLKALKA